MKLHALSPLRLRPVHRISVSSSSRDTLYIVSLDITDPNADLYDVTLCLKKRPNGKHLCGGWNAQTKSWSARNYDRRPTTHLQGQFMGQICTQLYTVSAWLTMRFTSRGKTDTALMNENIEMNVSAEDLDYASVCRYLSSSIPVLPIVQITSATGLASILQVRRIS